MQNSTNKTKVQKYGKVKTIKRDKLQRKRAEE